MQKGVGFEFDGIEGFEQVDEQPGRIKHCQLFYFAFSVL
jgi:hypothetical protein